ncbi:MAG: hypothetical protein QE263_08480 [Vampirovibrionales bacterium]|nr:hypothetical protein [Vampirovibrionales bacterium]
MITFSSMRFGYTPMRPTNQNEPHQGPATETKFSSSNTFVKSSVHFGNEWFAPNTEVEEPAVKEPTDVANGTNTTEETAPSETWLG